MSKVIVVSEYTKSEANSTGYFWECVIDRLVEDGVSVEIVTLNVPVGNSKKKHIFVRALSKFYVALKLSLGSCFRLSKNDVVFSGTNPELLFLILAIFRKVLRFRWCVLVHDVFPENCIPAGVVSENGVLYKLLRSVFSWVYKQPDFVFVIGRDMRHVIGNKRSIDSIFYVPNWVDSESVVVKTKQESKVIRHFGLEDKIVFLFFGNLGRLQGIDNLLKAADMVKSDKFAMLFIGDGVAADSIRLYMLRNPEKPIYYHPGLSVSERDDGLAAADVSVVSLQHGMYGLGVPSKTYFSMAADRPILAIMDEGSEVALMIDEEGIGWSCRAGDPVALANRIDEICCGNLVDYYGRVRRVFENKYVADISLAKISKEIQFVLKASL